MPGKGRAHGTVAMPELRRGRVALCFATLLARSTGRPVPQLDYASPARCYGVAQGQLAYYAALEREGHARVITRLAALDHHVDEWEAWDTACRQTQARFLQLVSSSAWRVLTQWLRLLRRSWSTV